MKIIIRETGKEKELSIIDNSGCDYIIDFVGNTGALGDQFIFDDDLDAWVCDQETFDWWDTVVSDNQDLEDRLAELRQEHGSDAVEQVIYDAGSVDIGDHAANLNNHLTLFFEQPTNQDEELR